jgi:hypothetical protein
MARIALLLGVLSLAVVATAPVAQSASRCPKGKALHKKRCVKKCPSGYVKKTARTGKVCRRKPASAPQPQPQPEPQQSEPIRGEEAKTILRSLLVKQFFENKGTTSGGSGSVSGREQYAFCTQRYGWYSFSSATIPGAGSTSDERQEGGTWMIDEAVADPGRRKASGRLTLTNDSGAVRNINVEIDGDGTDLLDGFQMESQPFDCSDVPGG